jgi:hypothetical protein
MGKEDSAQRLQRLLQRAQENWLPEDVASFRPTFESIAAALDTIAQHSFKLEDEPAYPATIRLSKCRAEDYG